MIDRYTKIVLTVIAAALVGLPAVQLTPVANAQGRGACGSLSSPCMVMNAYASPLYVRVVQCEPQQFNFAN
jgi:hypothetical protein